MVVSGYKDGDAKWMHQAADVEGGKYYKFSDFYKSDADTAVSKLSWQSAEQVTAMERGRCEVPGYEAVLCGTWATLETGVEPSSNWKRFDSGIDMPAAR